MKKIFYTLTAVALLSSCMMEDDFLDKVPLDKLSEDAVFNSPQLAEAHVNSFYTVLSDPFQEGNISAITDEGWFRYGGSSTRYMYDGRLSPSSIIYADEGGPAHNTRTTTLNIWNRAYQYIYNINYFLKYFNPENAKMDQATADRLKGEALFLRAWSYYNLIQRYAGVPIISTPHNLNDADFTVERANFDDCVEFIRKDIKDAYALLPAKESAALGRINKDIALALDARVTLLAASPLFNNPQFPNGGVLHGKYSAPDKSTGKWAEALKANKAVVDRAEKDGAYSLDAKYSGYWTNNKSPEIIWAKHFVPNETQNKAQLLYSVVYYNGWTSLEPTQAMIIDYEMTNGKKFFEDGSGYDPEHPFKNRDPRFYYTVAAPFSTYVNTDDKGTHENELGLFVQYDKSTYADFAKGMKEPSHTSKSKDLWSEASASGLELNKWYDSSKPITESETTTTHYPWFRLGEFFLNYAECAYMVGDEKTCRDYINKVRARADVNMPAVTETGENLWDRLVNERRVELAFEFTRYFDVRRWRIADFYENVPLAGMRTMILNGGAQPDTVYRMVRTAEQIDKNTCYYWQDSDAQAAWIKANGSDIKTIQEYKWMGKTYKLDFGECLLSISPTQKVFVEANYLMPIPETEIAKSLGCIKQNPGYGAGDDWNF